MNRVWMDVLRISEEYQKGWKSSLNLPKETHLERMEGIFAPV